ncbi:MAG TPA: 4-(cytidine 5'-diphospho)-2-C-methyl-D-erythritol kinase [Candidatus Binatia bacterium]|nr:4-(cytidine 5'-diphospho)-2-C-methyl-D-erythritol kinase [Candidatus Binatia bacterium]
MKIRAPAKINLYLRVVGRRKDGYHLLDTVLVPISLYDEIEIQRLKAARHRTRPSASPIKITCDHPLVPAGKKNLVFQAADLIMKTAGVDQPISIHVRKRIPVGAGLGGGSSDAAATLVALNRLFRLRYSMRRLEKLGLSLGADVPFFIRRRPARARGIGERLTPLANFPLLWLVILYPGFPVSTAWVYRRSRPKLTKPKVNTSITCFRSSFAKLREILVNDLEAVAIAKHPRIGMLKERLRCEEADGVLMSGSGSSVFGIFAARRFAIRAFKRLKQEKGVQAFLAHVLN